MASTLAKGLVEFVNPYRLPKFVKQVHIQMREIEGRQAFGQGLYHSEHYEKLMKSISESRVEYRSSKDSQQRVAIADEEYSQWSKYIAIRQQEVPDDFKISDQIKYEFKKTFDIYVQRNETDIQPSRLLEMFNEYTKLHQFNIPIDNWCVVQMIHYSMGYLLQLNRLLSFDELFQLLSIKVLGTYEKSLGQELLFREICAFAYWSLATQKGSMNPQEFSTFIKLFKYDVQPNIISIKREFQFAANLFQGEFSKDIDPNEEIIRFDFFRYIFLERNL